MSIQHARGKTTPASNNGSFKTYAHSAPNIELGAEQPSEACTPHTCSLCGNDYLDGTTRCSACGHLDQPASEHTSVHAGDQVDYGTLVNTDPRAAAMMAMSTTDSSALDALTESLPDGDGSPSMTLIRQAVMTNPATPHDAKKHILDTAPLPEAIAYAQDPRVIDADLLKNWIVDGADPNRVADLAGHKQTDVTTLGYIYALTTDREGGHRRALRRLIDDIHGGTDLSDHPEEEVRHLFASHAGQTGAHGGHAEALTEIAEGEDPHLAWAVYLNPQAPAEARIAGALTGLGTSDDHDAARDFFATDPAAAEHAQRIIDDIEKSGYHYATAAIASNPALPRLQQIQLNLLTDPSEHGRDAGGNDIRLRLASNAGVDLNVLATTLVDGNFREKDAAWRNPATHRPEALPILERLAADTEFYSSLTEPETWEFDRTIGEVRRKAQQS